MPVMIGKFRIRPEIDEPLYYLHLAIIAVVALGLLQLWFGGDMLTIQNVLLSMVVLLAGDIVAHTSLSLD